MSLANCEQICQSRPASVQVSLGPSAHPQISVFCFPCFSESHSAGTALFFRFLFSMFPTIHSPTTLRLFSVATVMILSGTIASASFEHSSHNSASSLHLCSTCLFSSPMPSSRYRISCLMSQLCLSSLSLSFAFHPLAPGSFLGTLSCLIHCEHVCNLTVHLTALCGETRYSLTTSTFTMFSSSASLTTK